ncbi:MAG TPA: hypothetical protein VF212_05880, partial [Longimicrobiales bacterium]
MRKHALAIVTLALMYPLPARAQYADWYLWHNEVEPTVRATVTLDSTTGDFLYRYSVANGPGARQRIQTLDVELAVTPSAMAAPKDWDFSFSSTTPVAGWWAFGPIDP